MKIPALFPACLFLCLPGVSADELVVPVPEFAIPVPETEFGRQDLFEQSIPQGHVADDIGEWIEGIAAVDVVLYDCSAGEAQALVENGKPHPGVAEAWTKRLTEGQTKELIKSVVGKHPPKMGAWCYEPHHGFIFRDQYGAILRHIEICFMCGNYEANPREGLSRHWDLKGLEALVKGMGLPTFRKPEEWSEFFGDKERVAAGPVNDGSEN